MRVVLKMATAFYLCIVVMLIVTGFARFQRESARFESELAHDHVVLTNGLSEMVATVWDLSGRDSSLAVVEHFSDRERHIDVHFLESGSGEERAVPPGAARVTAERYTAALPVETWVDHTEYGRFYSYVPVSTLNGRVGTIELIQDGISEKEFIRADMIDFAVTSGVAALAAGLIAVAIGLFMVGRPIRTLVQRVRRIGAGDLSPWPVPDRRDEIGFLAREIEATARSLADSRDRWLTENAAKDAAKEQLRHAERLATVGKLAAGMAHEIGTPLNVIAWRTRNIASGKAEGESARDNARIAHEQCERITRFVRQLLDFARRRAPEMRETDVVRLAEDTFHLVEHAARSGNVELEVSAQERPVLLHVDPSQIQQVFTNLYLNGLHAMPRGGKLHLDFRSVVRTPPAGATAGSRRWSRISVRDDGEGIAPENLPFIFDPFFTTKGVGEGTGLGLSVTWGILADHGGWIEAASTPGSGAEFTVFLPEGTP